MNIAAEQVHGVFFHNNLEKKNWHFLKKNFCYKMPIIDPNSSTYHSFPSWMYQSGEYPKISKSTLYF